MTSTLGDLNGTLVSIQGDIAIIKTDIGEIKVTLSSIKASQPSATSFWLVLAVVAAIAGVTVVALVLRKRGKKKT